MFAVDMNEVNTIPGINLCPIFPSTRHGNVYEINFNDGHAESIKWLAASLDWANTANPDPDWIKLKSMTTIHR